MSFDPTTHRCTQPGCRQRIDNRYNFTVCVRCSMRPVIKERKKLERERAAKRVARAKKAARTRRRNLREKDTP